MAIKQTSWRESGRASWRAGLAALCAVLAGAALAGGSASAAPTETVLYSFTGTTDGANPIGGVIADSSGNLYGTTEFGGINGQGCSIAFVGTGCGVAFKLSPSGTETVFYSFMGAPDGLIPWPA